MGISAFFPCNILNQYLLCKKSLLKIQTKTQLLQRIHKAFSLYVNANKQEAMGMFMSGAPYSLVLTSSNLVKIIVLQ